MLLDRVGWYARRLRSMQPRELLWRVRQAAQRPASNATENLTESDWGNSLAGFRAGADRPVLLDRVRALAIAEQSPDLVAPLIDAADRVVDGRYQFFGYPPVTLTEPINWHHDPTSNVTWPDMPSNRIDHRVADGDVKWIWELNRLQHLPLLAQGWLFTGDERYSRTAFAHLDTWIEQNPPGRGIAWRGAFEAGLRSISIAVALQGLRDAPELTAERYQRIVAVLALSAERCWRERSRFSSANNHLIGETAGLAVVALLFPDLPGAAQWERRAMRTLSTEADNLILPDGCGAEQSVGYQIATVELLHLVAALLVQRDGHAPAAITGAIIRSSTFLAAVVGDRDPDPRYGDADQEFAIRLGPEHERTVRQHLCITATLGWGPASANLCSRSLTAEWFRFIASSHGCARLEPIALGGSGKTPRDFFADDGGIVVMRRGRRRITMDVGPLGYPSIAAHGHADALSVTLSEEGQDLVGDPGTGSYYRHPQWRDALRATRAHPTVCVDGENQSVIGGLFLWSRHARTRVNGLDLEGGIVDAEHDGYSRLPGRVKHRRWLIAPPEQRNQLVVDLLSGNGIHEVRTTWPLHPSLGAVQSGTAHTVNRGESPVLQLLHAATEQLSLEDSRGDDANALGWWSDVLESRTPSWWLSAVCSARLPVVIATLIAPADDMTTTDLRVGLLGDTIEVAWNEDETLRSVTIRLDGSASVNGTSYL